MGRKGLIHKSNREQNEHEEVRWTDNSRKQIPTFVPSTISDERVGRTENLHEHGTVQRQEQEAKK